MNMMHISFGSRRLITYIAILLLNPLPSIYTLPTEKVSREKRNINLNNLFRPEEEINFERLLGCKYDFSLCNQNEVCFDDDLFGQCWNGKGSLENVFALKNGLNELTDSKILALEYTTDFLKRYHLDWKDYMTQCLLSQILIDQNYQINRHHLQLIYKDCLEKGQILNELTIDEEKNFDNINRRQIPRKQHHHHDPYDSWTEAEDLYLEPGRSYSIPLHLQLHRLSSLLQNEPANEFYGDDDAIPSQKSVELIAEESIMNEPTKISIHTNEVHPSLLETLQINNNKQVLPTLTEETTSHQNNNYILNTTNAERYFTVETARGYIIINRDFNDQIEGARLLALIAQINSWPETIFTELNADRHVLTFYVLNNAYQITASSVADSALHNDKLIENQLGVRIIDSGIGNPKGGTQLSAERQNGSQWTVIALVTCILAIFIMGSFAVLYFIKRNDRIRNKFAEITRIKSLATDDYRDLCREQMHSQSTHRVSSDIPSTQPKNGSIDNRQKRPSEDSSPRGSTSSWTEEPTTTINMDIMTGHLILSYMEDHLRDRHRLESEWQSLNTAETNEEQASCSIALLESNEKKNRYIDCLPYDHTRIRLENDEDGDYINASKITDSDPKCKYIATQGPLPNTTNAFWQMVWEQGSCVIVALTRPIENGMTMCHHYWPVEGCARFNDFEVNLVSEHIWSDDYVVRSFYLKNIQTMETRTITQFYYLTWDELSNPPSAKSLLDFRRKINKCFRGRSSPIIVHCNDGVGRTGTYILLDIVLNRIYKGAREINIAATLEHIRDQRPKMVKTKEQFEFVFIAVAEEVTSLLKSLPQ